MKRLIVIEDDPVLSNNIKQAMAENHMEVDVAYDAMVAEKLLRKNTYDCIVLDVNLPGKNGYEICNAFRKFNTLTPVLMLTAFGELEDKVQGFNSGADDYLTKPFYMRELLLRINALMKRNEMQSGKGDEPTLVADDVVIHLPTKTVTRQGVEIALTPREYQILLKLIKQKGELVSKKELIREIWGATIDAGTNTVEVYINFLRNKLDKPFDKQSIKTKVGYGYYFETA